MNPGTPETTTPSPTDQPGSANPGTATQAGKEQEKKYTPTVGSYAPPFTTFTLDNKQISLDQFKGKTVILKFWASWCAKCQATAPELNKFYADHPNDVAIIAINLNQADTFDGINQYIQRYKITYPVAVDITGDISTLYRVSQTSTYFIIDPQGVIRQIFTYQTLKAKDFETAYQKAQQPAP
ncbi:TlpA family protein disulfide reductase [Candidatus Acetothermia bacterium]|nr:TlpA family protein disulfide reductase [Candidatus Acetothermia bacterium]